MAHQDEHNISTPFQRASTFFIKGETIPADLRDALANYTVTMALLDQLKYEMGEK
jgi:hypothetical protein